MSQTAPHDQVTSPLLPDLLRQCEAALADDGFCYLPQADPLCTVRAVKAFDAVAIGSQSGSCRLAATDPLVALLLEQPCLAEFLDYAVGPAKRPVRAIAFDKTERSNWFVPWHQDRTIAVMRRDDRADAKHWTVKNGVPHCEAPINLLESMVTLRWHLDPVLPGDGPLQILPGTHRSGRLDRAAIHSLAETTDPLEILADTGDVVAMRPLLVHASSRRRIAGRRRIVHVEFAAGDPPAPLQWAWSASDSAIAVTAA